MEKKVSSIIDKAKREFHFLQDRKKGFGLVLNIPMSEQTPIEYVKNFLKKLL